MDYENVSLLITHYKRSQSLEHLLTTFENLDCKFGEIVVSDDGSPPEHLDYIHNVLAKRFSFKLITTPVNRGLGNNINKGQDAVSKPYTLYVQEDFEPQEEFTFALQQSLQYMEKDNSLDIVRYYAYFPYPYLKSLESDDLFSTMYIPTFGFKYTKIYFYSDHPHLRRSDFFTKFGRYREGIKGDRTEYHMCISFIQHKGKGIFCKKYNSLFLQKNSITEPSTMKRSDLKMSTNAFISVIRNLYRQVRYNYDIHFSKA